MSGDATPAQIAAFWWRCAMKGETVDRDRRARPGDAPPRDPVACPAATAGGHLWHRRRRRRHLQHLDRRRAGRGGRGVAVAKHGNRAVSVALRQRRRARGAGRRHRADAERSSSAASTRSGIGFLFAPAYHPAMRHAGPVRRELGVRTIFNVLGPLTNPAGRPPAADGRLRTAPGERWPRCWQAGSRARPGGTRRRRPGRAHPDRREHDGRGARPADLGDDI